MADVIGSFVWRFNHKTECWDKLVSTDAETYTAYQYNKTTKDWTNVVTLYKQHDSASVPAASYEYAYWYCEEKFNVVEDYYHYIDEDTETQIEGTNSKAYDNSVPGTVWKWNGSGWETISEINTSKKTYFISHGMSNTYQQKWIADMAKAIYGAEGDVQILTVDWGDWSGSGLNAFKGANHTEETAARAAIFLAQQSGTYQESYSILGLTRRTVKADLGITNLNLIGHSHGGHVCAYLATYSDDKHKPKTLVGLDVSEEIVHEFHGGVDWDDSCAEKFYFYKSSPIFGDEFLRGKYNFTVVADTDPAVVPEISSTPIRITGTVKDAKNFWADETGHGYSPVWYTASFKESKSAGYSIESTVYYADMVEYFKSHEKNWIGVSDPTFKVECLDIGYDKKDSDGMIRWNFEKYYTTLKGVVDNRDYYLVDRKNLADEFHWPAMTRAVGYLTDYSVDNKTISVASGTNEVTTGEDTPMIFTINNNADNIAFDDEFVKDAQENQRSTFQVWLSVTDTLNTEDGSSLRIYEDDLHLTPDRGSGSGNSLTFNKNITISQETVEWLFPNFKLTGETDAYLFVRAGGKEGTGEYIDGELYETDNTSKAQKITIKANDDIKYIFVIDDTGSMSGSIGSVRSALQSFITDMKNKYKGTSDIPLMQLITFQDSVTQRLTTNNLDEMYAAVSGLYAYGGGDYPEYSNHALAQAVSNIGKNGTILFATDAPSHEGINMNSVMAEARSKGVRINSILSGVSSSSASLASVSPLMIQEGAVESEEYSFDYGDTLEAATGVYVGNCLKGTVNYSNNAYDWTRVYLQQYYTYSFGLATQEDQNAFFSFYDKNGTNCVGTITAGNEFVFSPDQTGYYYMRVRAIASEDTPYELSIEQTQEKSKIGTTLDSFAVMSAETGGACVIQNFESAIYNVLASTLQPAVISATPYSIPKASTADISLTGYGTNWKDGETTVSFNSDNITTLAVRVISPTELIATVQVSDLCLIDNYDVNVVVGEENAYGKEVVAISSASSYSKLVSVATEEFRQGNEFTATIRGVNTSWTEDSTVSFGSAVTVSNVEWVSCTELKVTGVIADSAAVGYRTVSVRTNGYSDSLSYAVFLNEKAPELPTVTWINNDLIQIGTDMVITLKCDKISLSQKDISISAGSGITFSSIKVVDENTIRATVLADQSASLGFRDVSVTSGKQTATMLNGLEITDAIVSVSSSFSGKIDEKTFSAEYAGRYVLQGTSDITNGSVKILDGKKAVATATIKNGSVVFNSKNAFLLDGDKSYTMQITQKGNGNQDLCNSAIKLVALKLFADGDNGDDWTTMKTEGAAGLAASVGTVDKSGDLPSGWVGYGDAVDYRSFMLESAANLAFDLNATDAAKFTIYSLQSKTDKKGVTTYSLKSLQATTLKAGVDTTTKNLLLDKGTYYIAMESTNAKKGGSADYTVAVSDKTTFFTKGDNGDDWTTMKTEGAAGLADSVGTVDKPGELLSGWVGYGDAVDYKSFTLESAANLAFDMDATDAAKFTVYSLQSKTDKKGVTTYSLKSLQATTLKAGVDTTTKNLLFDKGTYYIAMESTNAKKGGSADYDVAVSEKTTFFTKGDNSDDWADMKTSGASGLADPIRIGGETGDLLNGWVGYGDAVDYQAFTLDHAADLSFDLDVTDAAKFSIFSLQDKTDKNGVTTHTLKSLQSTSLKAGQETTTKSIHLEAGTYYLAMESTNAKKGGSVDYAVAVADQTKFYADEASDIKRGFLA